MTERVTYLPTYLPTCVVNDSKFWLGSGQKAHLSHIHAYAILP